MEEDPLIINKNNKYEKIISNMEESIESMILFRSLYLIKKKFEIYKSNINKIYLDYNINKSKRIDALGSYQIDINFFDNVLFSILKETNLFILEISSPKDIFLSYFLITSQKAEHMNLIIRNIKNELIQKNLNSKYNKIFYDKKIKPLFNTKVKINIEIEQTENNFDEENNNISEEIIIKEKIIVEYNKKGKIIKTFDELLTENEKNINDMKNKQLENNKNEIEKIENNINIINSNDNLKKNNNILFIETLPLIIADYLQEHKNFAVVEIEEEFSKELDLLFNKDLLIKINKYDEFVKKYKNYNNNTNIISKELKQYSLQLKQIQKNITLYEQIIVDKKMKNENTLFLEDMLNKLVEKETYVQQKINERKQNIYSLNKNEQNINKIKSYNYFNSLDLSPIKNINFNNNINNNVNNNINLKSNIHILSIKNPKLINESKISNNNKNNKNNSSSILITSQNNNLLLNTKNSILNNTSKKIKLKTELTEEKIQSSLTEIFLYYSTLINVENNNINNIESDNDITNKSIILSNYYKFCYDFKIPLLKPKINEIFKKYSISNINNNDIYEMDFDKFKSSLIEISLVINSIYKEKLLKKISEKKNIINYMELKECQRQEEEKNHNKFTERITGGIAKKAMEQNQFDYISKHKKIMEEITKYELDYEKECKKSEKEILYHFYKYLGIHNSNYKNKLKNIKTNYFLNDFKITNGINSGLKTIDIQRNKVPKLRISKSNLNNKSSIYQDTLNNNNYKENKIINIKKLNNYNENNILKISNISNQKLSSSKIFQNSNKINWNQLNNIYFEYNPIYENKINNIENNEYNMEDGNIKYINNKKLIKNHSALDLKGITNKDSILPPILTNNNIRNENNLRYYEVNNSTQKTIELKNKNDSIYNNED